MKISQLIKIFQKAEQERGDLDILVSVDLSTEDESTQHHRAFGDVYDVTFLDSKGSLVLLAESGKLNF